MNKLTGEEIIRQMQNSSIDRIVLVSDIEGNRRFSGSKKIAVEIKFADQNFDRDDPYLFEAVNQRLSNFIANNSEFVVSELLNAVSAEQIKDFDSSLGGKYETSINKNLLNDVFESCCPVEKLRAGLRYSIVNTSTEKVSDTSTATDEEIVAASVERADLEHSDESNDLKISESISVSSHHAESIVDSDMVCYQLGPRFSRKALYQSASKFKQLGLTTLVKSRNVDRETGYMVYFPAAETFDASRANLKMLKSKGVGDLWLINKGEMKGSISLGIFNSRTRAEVMRGELEGKGIFARIQPKMSKRTGYFLVFGAVQPFDELSDQLDGTGFEAQELVVTEYGQCEA